MNYCEKENCFRKFFKNTFKKERNKVGFYTELNFILIFLKIVVAECSIKVNKLNITLYFIKF